MAHRKIAYRNPGLWAALFALLLLSATATLLASGRPPEEAPPPPSSETESIQGKALPMADTWTAAEPDAMGYWMVRAGTP